VAQSASLTSWILWVLLSPLTVHLRSGLFFDQKLNFVAFSQSGGSGQAHYESEEGSFNLYWEFGGGDVLAIVNVPKPEHWLAQTGIAVERRAAVLDYIGSSRFDNFL